MSEDPLKVLVVDDERPARARLARLLLDFPETRVIGEASDGAAALEAIATLRPDLVFLDIQMPELDGLGVAAALGADGPAVIFATAFDTHAIRAFDLSAVDYLLKPIRKERLGQAIERAKKRLLSRTGGGAREEAQLVSRRLDARSRKMAVRTGAKYVVFDTDDVTAIVAQGDYAAILVGGRELLTDDSLEALSQRLPEKFLRVHRAAIVNLDRVSELQHEGDRKYVAILTDPSKTRVAVSRERLGELKRRLGID